MRLRNSNLIDQDYIDIKAFAQSFLYINNNILINIEGFYIINYIID